MTQLFSIYIFQYWCSGAYSSGQEFARRFTESPGGDKLSENIGDQSVSITEQYISDSLKDKYTGHSPLHIGDQCLESSNLENKQQLRMGSSIGGSIRHASNSPGGGSISHTSTSSASGGKKSSQNVSVIKEKVLDKKSLTSQLDKDCKMFMRGVMDECTHLGNFSVPVDPELIIIVAANHDSYIPRDDVMRLDKLWPGSEVRYIPAGHIVAYLSNHYVFR